jgi:hypothetical protein
MCKDNKNLGKTGFLFFLCWVNTPMKRIIAILSGCILAVFIIFMSEAASHSINPPPENIDFNNRDQLKQIMQEAPFLALFMVQMGAFLGALAGGMVASAVMKSDDKLPALGVGAVLTVLSLINLMMIPHPLWFTLTGLVVYVAGAYCGHLIYLKFRSHDQKN